MTLSQFQDQLRVGTSRLLQLAYELCVINLVLLLLGWGHVVAYLNSTQQWFATAGCILLYMCGCMLEWHMKKKKVLGCLIGLLQSLQAIVEGCIVYGVLVTMDKIVDPTTDRTDALVQTTGFVTLWIELIIVLVAIVTRMLCLPEPDDEDETTDDSMEEAYKPLINSEKPIAYIHVDTV